MKKWVIRNGECPFIEAIKDRGAHQLKENLVLIKSGIGNYENRNVKFPFEMSGHLQEALIRLSLLGLDLPRLHPQPTRAK